MFFFGHRDVEIDNTNLIGEGNIHGQNAVTSHTPADYERADDSNYENPLYGAGVEQEEEIKADPQLQ